MARHIIRGRMRAALTAALAAATALAGCGGGDDDEGGATPTTTVAAGEPLVVTATEYRFEPAAIEVDAGSADRVVLRIELSNEGAVAHDLHVRSGARDHGGTPIFGPGQTKRGQVRLAPGEYGIVCTVGDHEELGMKGTLVVR
jgi:plastocyanin